MGTHQHTVAPAGVEEYPKVYLYRRIVQAKLYIDANYAEDIDLDNISDEAYFSKFHFIRLFKSIYGKTPHQYLQSIRIGQAMQLLRNNKSVADACFSVGFQSLTTFSGLFKKVTGETPSAFLQRHQTVNRQIRATPLSFIPGCYAHRLGLHENSNFEE